MLERPGQLAVAPPAVALQVAAGDELQHGLQGDVQRGDRAMRGLEDKDIRPLFEQLEALGWLGRAPNARPSMQPIWHVNPMVHTLYADRAKTEAARRKEAKAALGHLFQRED